MYKEIQKEIKQLASIERAISSKRFFKTGIGEYGEGDIFIGLSVPQMRKLIQQYQSFLHFADIEILMHSKIHEERFVGVLTLVAWMKLVIKNNDKQTQKHIFNFYVTHISGVNNWDLVDVSAHVIVGPYISEHMNHKERLAFIKTCIESESVWINRIIVVASYYQIKKGNEKLTFYIVEHFLSHPHDLIHKACGWMLREVGKHCSTTVLESFLLKYKTSMPRTMLRYAIEKFSLYSRKLYLQK